MYILGVRIDNLKRKDILEKIEDFLRYDKFHQIATINPEFILQAQHDEEYKKILNDCDLNIADGVGIWYAFIRNFSYLKSRFAGVDLMQEILRIAEEKKLSVYLAVNDNGLSKFEEIKTALEKKYPNLIFNGKNVDKASKHLYEIRNTKYEILLCNFGAPEQEKFLSLQKNGTIGLSMGVGGSFDFVTGKVKRAPKMMQYFGFEWLWRIFLHPSSDKRYLVKRYKRILNSVLIFPIKIIFFK